LVGLDGGRGGGGGFAVGGAGVVAEEVQAGLQGFGVGAAVLVFFGVFVLDEPVGDVFVAVQGGQVVGGEAAGIGDVKGAFLVVVFFEGVQFAFARGAQGGQALVAAGVVFGGGFVGFGCGGFGGVFAFVVFGCRGFGGVFGFVVFGCRGFAGVFGFVVFGGGFVGGRGGFRGFFGVVVRFGGGFYLSAPSIVCA